MHECKNGCLHSFQHYAVYMKIFLQHVMGEDLIYKEVIGHDLIKEQEKFVEIPSLREFINFNKARGTWTIRPASSWIFFSGSLHCCCVQVNCRF